MADILPAIFFGHGNPMNAVAHNVYTEAWRRIGEEIQNRRRSCLCPHIGMCPEPASLSRQRRAPSMISAAFLRNSIRCNIRLRVSPPSRGGSNGCFRH